MRLFFRLSWLLWLTVPAVAQQVNPPAPKESYRLNARDVTSERYLSTIHVPVDITTAEVERQINTHLQGLIYEDDSLQEDDFACKVWKRAPIRVEAIADQFHLHIPLKIWAKFGYGFRPMGYDLSQYKETEFEVDAHFVTKFNIAADWTAHTSTTLQGFDWVSKPAIKFGPVSIPIASIVGKIINNKRETITKAIDESVRKNVEIRKYVVQAWNTALQPYLLSEKYRTWLQLTPTALEMTPLKAAGTHVRATVGIKVLTQTVFGEKPAVRTVTTVPDLKLVNQVPNDFKVGLIAQLSHPEAQRLLADTIVGKTFTFREGRYRVQVQSVDLYGSEERLIIKAQLKGSLSGTVYFRGIPIYNATERLIELKDLDYDLDTRSFLLRTANWFLQGRFKRQLEEAFRFPIGEQLDNLQHQVQAALQRRTVAKGVILSGTIQQVQPEGVYLVPDAILAVVFAQGQLTLQIDGL